MLVYNRAFCFFNHVHAGEALAEELARRIGKHKCYRVRWPDGIKDANQMLVERGIEQLRACINNAEEYPVEGLQRYA